MFADQIARVCHEANRALCEATGDRSQVEWEDAEPWQRDSAIEGVAAALQGATPEELHESWCAFKIADGWSYAPVKSGACKTHPCLVPYAELPAEQQAKDRLFAAIVKALSA